MTDLEIPIMNPFIFNLSLLNGSNVTIDYENQMPIDGLMQLNEQYQAGIFPSEPNVYPDWKTNEEIAIQINGDITSALAIINGPGIRTAMSQSTITPAGYLVSVRKFTYTPTVEGYYYINLVVSTTSNAYEFISHTFKVGPATDKNLIELGFYADENTPNFVFDAVYKSYYTSQWKIAQQQRNSSIIDEDVTNLVASKSYAKKTVTLTEINHLYYDVVAKQLESEYVYLNGLTYICKEPPDFEYTGKSDLVNITFELTAKYNNNIINYS
jgi:hypothetical protein